MKVLANILLVITTIPLFLLFVFSINLRFQFMNADFWMNAFKEGNTYQTVSDQIKNNLESNAIKSGGLAGDVIDLSNLVSVDNVESFFEDNVQNFLLYANGKSPEIMVSFPFSNSMWDLSSKMKLTDVIEEYNIEIINPSDIESISKYGKISWVATITLFVLTNLSIFLMYILTKPGKHLVFHGITLTLSGIIMTAIYVVGRFVSEVVLKDYSIGANIGKSLFAIIASPVIQSAVQTWLWFGASSLILGIILFFIKKPANNQK